MFIGSLFSRHPNQLEPWSLRLIVKLRVISQLLFTLVKFKNLREDLIKVLVRARRRLGNDQVVR